MFVDWINILIQKDHVARSIHLVEMVLYYYISCAEKFKISELLKNYDWTTAWCAKMATTDFFGYTEMFLNNEPYCFLIFTKVLRCYRSARGVDMLNLLTMIQYDIWMRMYCHDEAIYNEVMEMLHLNLNPEELESITNLLGGEN